MGISPQSIQLQSNPSQTIYMEWDKTCLNQTIYAVGKIPLALTFLLNLQRHHLSSVLSGHLMSSRVLSTAVQPRQP